MNTTLQTTILEDFRKLSPLERLDVVEAAVQIMRADWRRDTRQQQVTRQQNLTRAAEALRDAYENDAELTAFTSGQLG